MASRFLSLRMIVQPSCGTNIVDQLTFTTVIAIVFQSISPTINAHDFGSH